MTTISGTQADSTADFDRPSPATTLLVDVDTHPFFLGRDLLTRLEEPWRSQFAAASANRGSGTYPNFPRLRNGGYRIDAAVPDGFAGSDLGYLQRQLLDEYKHDLAVLIPLVLGFTEPPDYQAAICKAINEWVKEEWLDRDPRLRGTLNLPFDYPDLALAEIERYADDPRFVQLLILSQSHSEWGDRKYWPIYEAAEERGLVLMYHVGGMNNAYRGSGVPSYYLEQHILLGGSLLRLAMSLVCSGVFDRFPRLQVALIEGGISWMGPLQWAMDATYGVLGHSVPSLDRPPSAYLREHFWMSTQPIEEPDDPSHLLQALQFTGMLDRIMFASDYPHWDFDSPTKSLPVSIQDEVRENIMGRNACRLYNFEPVRSIGELPD